MMAAAIAIHTFEVRNGNVIIGRDKHKVITCLLSTISDTTELEPDAY